MSSWDQRYLQGEHLHESPSSLLTAAVAELPPGGALDLACGPGRNAIWLAQRGWRVIAVDSSPVALDLLRQRAVQAGVTVDARLADLERDEFVIAPESFDLICDIRYLQRDLFPRIQAGLRPGGMVVAEILLGAGRFHMSPGELRGCFQDLDILRYDEASGVAAELVALKPQRGGI
ncbi:MAG: class I SAM-dependent methyltransferase [Acidobacteria bacterium]|nr:class I SAM-dependent methyltransferase [Acidobacteriota bacterium]